MIIIRKITDRKICLYIFFSITFILSGCSSKKVLVPVQTEDQSVKIIEEKSALISCDDITLTASAKYKNQFVIFGLSVANNYNEELIIKKEDITVLDGKDVIQNILDEDQIENLYDTYLYISIFPTGLYRDDPFFYPYHRGYYDNYYRFSMDRKLFLTNLYKNIFRFGKCTAKSTLKGDIYILNGKLDLPLKLHIELKEKKFNFQFDKIPKKRR